MANATHILHTRPTLSESPIDWRMDIQLHEDTDHGHSSEGLGLRNVADRFRLRLSQPCNDIGEPALEALHARELLQRIHDLTARVEHLEALIPLPSHAVPAFDADVEAEPSQDVFDDPDEIAGVEAPHSELKDGGMRLNDLPRGPLSIDVVARALGKTARTIRGWCQVEKYEIPAHKEAGHWRFYKDELLAWHEDYEAISRRDGKRAQAKRRKTKHGNQGV